MLKRINGVMTPQNMRDAWGSWIVLSARLTCGLCKRSGQTDTMQFLDPKVAEPMGTAKAETQRWQAYKRHIKDVHDGSWNQKQGIRRIK